MPILMALIANVRGGGGIHFFSIYLGDQEWPLALVDGNRHRASLTPQVIAWAAAGSQEIAKWEGATPQHAASSVPDGLPVRCALRLAPILMTSVVTALGVLPLAIGMNDPGREIEGPYGGGVANASSASA